MVFYRKYRPQTLKDLDNPKLRQTLSTVLQSASVPHAFLFTGPKGLGKTSAARIVAKIINCETLHKTEKTIGKKQTSIEPCNTCEQCASITSGMNVDILEIDAASNRGIDEIRDLREKLRLAPMRAKKKVYIIDEVHMLTTEAFNALLKTLEEPPSHVVFILCTTEPHKVPETIVSRCVHVAFTKATDEELVHSFKRIAAHEKLSVSDEAFLALARVSDGSFRDGAKLFEEIVQEAKGEKITKELIENRYKITTISVSISFLLSALKEHDTKRGIEIVNALANQGVNMKYVLEELISTLHGLLLKTVGIPIEKDLPGVSFSKARLQQIIKEALHAHAELRVSVLPQLPVELFVLKTTERDDTNGNLDTSQGGFDMNAKTQWQTLIDTIRKTNYSLAGVLRSCSLRSVSDKELIIETAYTFHKGRLQEEEATRLLQKAWQELTGNFVAISVLLKK